VIGVHKFRIEDIEAHVDVALETYDRPEIIGEDHIRWKHLDSPYGPSEAVTLSDKNAEGRLHGRSFIMPRPFITSGGNIVSGATVADLVIRPESRNAGRLIAMVKAAKQFDKCDLIIHSSNEVSDVFYRRMFKFPVRFSLVSAGLPVRLKSYVRKAGKGDFLAQLADFMLFPARLAMPLTRWLSGAAAGLKLGDMPSRTEIDSIHEAHHARTGPQFQRSADYVEWRYLSGPISRSDVVGLYQKGGATLGYAALRRVNLDGMKFCILMDLVTHRALSSRELMALKFAIIDKTRKTGDDIAFAMFNSEHLELAKLSGFPFINIPDSSLPHPTPIFLHEKGETIDKGAAKTLFFMVGDLDYF